jgi:hypothetical protein
MIAYQEELEANQKEREAVLERQEVPNHEAAVEIRGTGGRTSNQPWDTETH